LERLEVEHDNLRAALEWCRAEEDGGDGLVRFAAALWRFWLARCHLAEGKDALDAALERSEGAPARVKAMLLSGRAWIACWGGDNHLVMALCEQSLPLAQVANDRRLVGLSLALSGCASREQGDLESSVALFEEAHAQAVESGDPWSLSFTTHLLGAARLIQGRYEESAALQEACLAASREIGESFGVAYSLLALVDIASMQRDYATARVYLRESLETFKQAGDCRGIALGLLRAATLAEVRGDPGRAAMLLGAAEALRKASGVPLEQLHRPQHDPTVAVLRAALDDAEFAAAWSAGGALSVEDALAYALMETTDACLPTGTMTFLFTDIEGSTKLWEEHPEATRVALEPDDTSSDTPNVFPGPERGGSDPPLFRGPTA
jgi:non-specific serine/threonine protein kinase